VMCMNELLRGKSFCKDEDPELFNWRRRAGAELTERWRQWLGEEGALVVSVLSGRGGGGVSQYRSGGDVRKGVSGEIPEDAYSR